jgi:hypothetical protein
MATFGRLSVGLWISSKEINAAADRELGSGFRRLLEVCLHSAVRGTGVRLHASERHVMIALLLGATTLAVGAFCWFGSKARRRIQEWGRNMNEIDSIFQDMNELSDYEGFARNKERLSTARPIGSHGLAALK